MLTGITWAQFLEGIALLLIGYYVVVGMLYFKKEISVVVQRKANAATQENDETYAQSSQDPLMPQIYELMVSIKEHMQRAATHQYVSNETIFGLQQLIQQYPAVKASRFIPSINNEIIQLSNELLAHPFTDDELTAIWN